MTNDTKPGSRAVLFDIDGTLVDSNYLHIDAWDRAFVEIGHPVDLWRIHRSIGMDSGKLLERLLGTDASSLGEDAKKLHSSRYLSSTDRLRPISDSTELLAELARRGHSVVLATSAPEEELKILLGVLEVDDSVQAVTSSEDVGTAKPDPDIIQSALEKAGVSADQAVMVGDSVWDVEAAKRAGVQSIGVLSGGFSREELLEAGAAAVYEDIAALLRELDDSPIARQGS
ncbi:HAD family hydrolase [Subtercola boreus]|uniref:HAD family hydrolase n=1 Tax=Subtercola boreus TaxID=120213 RepID=A0A3E0W6M8_9MICO|nr:HAD family hydrolase [Subtercola boreus]RFA18132.1 HAD family hydrolase [Subtercola boreus]RFA18514.1 HAD family hydrolase [Subtercola boreus]RFA25042.1 HAD family hydrolase [Subtercola boreus]